MAQTITERVLKARVERIQENAGARNTIAEEDTVAALLANEPAFGSTATYHNQLGSLFAMKVARLRSIEEAQKEMSGRYGSKFDMYGPIWLDYMLPLNDRAAIMLAVAYQNAGIFLTSEELLKRTERVEFGMEDVA